MAIENETTSTQAIRLYRDLADWYPLLTPVGDYAEEADFYRRLFEAHCQRPPRTLLDPGSGGGHNAAHLKAALACTLVDLELAMLELSRRTSWLQSREAASRSSATSHYRTRRGGTISIPRWRFASRICAASTRTTTNRSPYLISLRKSPRCTGNIQTATPMSSL
jgi:hypothetical protein